jgi:uncharacterized membrane protein
MMSAQTIWHVLDSNAKILVVNLIQMSVEVVPIVKSKIINPSVLALEASLVTLLSLVESLQGKTFVLLILVDLVPPANLAMTGLAVTGQFVPALLASEETH